MHCVKGNNCQHVDLSENPVHGTALTSSVVMKWNAKAKEFSRVSLLVLIKCRYEANTKGKHRKSNASTVTQVTDPAVLHQNAHILGNQIVCFIL